MGKRNRLFKLVRKVRKQNENGFSLLELMMGLLFLAVGLLSIGAMQVVAIQGNSFSKDLTKATMLAQTKLEELKRLGFNDSNLSSGDHNEGSVAGSIFSRNYRVQDTTSTMKSLTVTVQWTDRTNHNVSLSTIRSK